jgi:LysR family transcriptional activator of dmlA
MDKLQAIRYFLRVIEAGSFSAAARQLEVSPPAVTKLVAALEREIGTRLLHRDAHRVALTPDGEIYLKTCSRIVVDLERAEQLLNAGRTKASGKLVVGMSRVLGANCVMPFVQEFISQQPSIELDFRLVHYPHENAAGLCDVLVLIGWHHDNDWIARIIAPTRFITAAAPAYWSRHGAPADPADLERHQCLVHRVPNGVVLDLWRYSRGEESRNVALRPADRSCCGRSRSYPNARPDRSTLARPWIDSASPSGLDGIGIATNTFTVSARRQPVGSCARVQRVHYRRIRENCRDA